MTATVPVLFVLSGVVPQLATNEEWGHAIIVAIFAVVLPLRMRSARRGSRRALRAVVIIGAVLVVVNVVEAVIPELFPVWMRIEMVLLAALMVVLVIAGVHCVRGSAIWPAAACRIVGPW